MPCEFHLAFQPTIAPTGPRPQGTNMSLRHTCILIRVTLFLCATTAPASYSEEITIKAVALSGNTIGTPSSELTINRFLGSPYINDQQQVVSRIELSGPNTNADNSTAIALFSPNNSRLVARKRNKVSGFEPLDSIWGIDTPSINNAGDIVCRVLISDDTSNGTESSERRSIQAGVLFHRQGSNKFLNIKKISDPLSLYASGTRIDNPILNDNSDLIVPMSFGPSFSYHKSLTSIIKINKNTSHAIATEGCKAPTYAPSAKARYTYLGSPATNSMGQVAFSTGIEIDKDGHQTIEAKSSIFLVNQDGSTRLLFKSPQSAKVNNQEVQIELIGQFELNSQGSIVADAKYTRNGQDHQSIILKKTTADPISIISSEETFQIGEKHLHPHIVTYGSARINNSNDVVLPIGLKALQERRVKSGAIFLFSNESRKLVAQVGQRLAPFPANQLIGYLGQPVLNDRKIVAFHTRLYGEGVSRNNDEAIVVRDSTGKIHIVVRKGHTLKIPHKSSQSPGIQKTVATIGFGPGQGPETGRSTLNNNGHLLFTLSFKDGTSGLFTAKIP